MVMKRPAISPRHGIGSQRRRIRRQDSFAPPKFMILLARQASSIQSIMGMTDIRWTLEAPVNPLNSSVKIV